jgi:hypothetical protein
MMVGVIRGGLIVAIDLHVFVLLFGDRVVARWPDDRYAIGSRVTRHVHDLTLGSTARGARVSHLPTLRRVRPEPLEGLEGMEVIDGGDDGLASGRPAIHQHGPNHEPSRKTDLSSV